MSRTFKISKNAIIEQTRTNLYNTELFKFEPGVTILVGCNGFGKSTLLKQIEYQLKNEYQLPYVKYDNYNDGLPLQEQTAQNQEYKTFSIMLQSSEGENIIIRSSLIGRKIGKMFRNNPLADEYYILLDGVDSGLSIDNMVDLKKHLFDLIINDNKNKDVYIICSANSYEMTIGYKCMNILTGEDIYFNTYYDYKAFILKTKEIKDNRKDVY
jgi:Fe-S cluster assembly ATPase SufC